MLKSVVFKWWPESGESGPGGTRGLISNCLRTGSLKKYCFERVARKWEIRTWSHRGAKKQLCKDRLFKKVLFLKGGQKVGNQDLEAPGAQKQLCNDRLFEKVLF